MFRRWREPTFQVAIHNPYDLAQDFTELTPGYRWRQSWSVCLKRIFFSIFCTMQLHLPRLPHQGDLWAVSLWHARGEAPVQIQEWAKVHKMHHKSGSYLFSIDYWTCWFSFCPLCECFGRSGSDSLFNSYTQSGCVFECRLRGAVGEVGCLPWDFPHFGGDDGLSVCDSLQKQKFRSTYSSFIQN